jgi:hypothetical protein
MMDAGDKKRDRDDRNQRDAGLLIRFSKIQTNGCPVLAENFP